MSNYKLPGSILGLLVKHLGASKAVSLCVTRWKDGIDIEEPISEVKQLLDAVAQAAYTAGQQEAAARIAELEADLQAEVGCSNRQKGELDDAIARIAELELQVQSLMDDASNKVMAMSEAQLDAMNRMEGRDPKDVATIGRQTLQLAQKNVRIAELELLVQKLTDDAMLKEREK